MKIAIDIRSIGRQRTGDESYTLNLVQNLLKIDLENEYFLLTNTDDSTELEKIRIKLFGNSSAPSNYHIISILPSSKLLWTFFALPLWLFRNQIDVLHVQYITPLIMPSKTRLVDTIHDVSFDAYPQFIKTTDLIFLKILIPLSLFRADRIIAISQFTKNEIHKYHNTPKDKIEVVYNGGAAERYFSCKNDFQTVSQKYNIEKPYIFHAGTLQPRKNVSLIISAFEELVKQENTDRKLQNIQLFLTGNLEQHNVDNKIKQKLTTLEESFPEIYKRIKFLGYVDEMDLPTIMQGAEALVVTSLYEGFGLPAIEAMATETPVIANLNSCLEEVLQDAAILYKKNDYKELSDCIKEVIINENVRDNLIKKGKERASFFNWEKTAQKTKKVFEDVY